MKLPRKLSVVESFSSRSRIPGILALFTVLILGISACTTDGPSEEYPEQEPGGDGVFLGAEPPVNSVLSQPPRQLRLYFNDLPNVERSELALIGPDGNLEMRGFHTMGADDLMIEIVDDVVPGEYTVQWTAILGESENQHKGSYQFTVE